MILCCVCLFAHCECCMCLYMCCIRVRLLFFFFFFQAEDGIRDRSPSRGLGDVYKRQIKHKRITTTVAKAKALKKFVEPLITKSKEDTTNSRRVVFSNLQDKIAVTELFKEISVKIADRPGGYTRIIKTGNRLGDNAEMCFIELVDYNENMAKEKVAKKATRTRRSKKAAEAAPAAVEVPATEAPKAEEPKAESAE